MNHDEPKMPNVVIVGAGFAGLKCAIDYSPLGMHSIRNHTRIGKR